MSELSSQAFLDRRRATSVAVGPEGERRQFTNSHEELSPPARELGLAVDRYKLTHRRRFITYEELLHVIQSLGYTQSEATTAAANERQPVGV